MKKLIFIFIMALMMGGSTSQVSSVDYDEPIKVLNNDKELDSKPVVVLLIRGDYGELIMVREVE